MSQGMFYITTKGDILIEERNSLKKSLACLQQQLDDTEYLLKMNDEKITQLLIKADAQEASSQRKNLIQMLTEN